MFFMFKHEQVSTLCGYYFKYKNGVGGGGGGHCVLKWILRKHKIMGESIQNRSLPSTVVQSILTIYILDAVTLSGILKAKQKLGRTFNSDKLGGIAFTKISKLTMCVA
jgi:hypothetical protein